MVCAFLSLSGLKDSGFQRTKQKSWGFYCGKAPKVLALEVVFDFIDLTLKAHYKDQVWSKPSSTELSEAVDILFPAA